MYYLYIRISEGTNITNYTGFYTPIFEFLSRMDVCLYVLTYFRQPVPCTNRKFSENYNQKRLKRKIKIRQSKGIAI